MDNPEAASAQSADADADQSETKVYLLSERGLNHNLRRLALRSGLLVILAEVVALTMYLLSPLVGGGITTLATVGVILLPLLLLFLIPADIRNRRTLWRSVRVEVGDDRIAVRHMGVPGIHILPQSEVRVRREQITAVQETPAGLEISTPYDPQALIIPVQLDEADRREIAATLSTWCGIQPQPSSASDSAIARFRANVVDSQKCPRGIPPFYEDGDWVFLAGIIGYGAFIALLTMVLVVSVRDLELPMGLRIVILSLYLVSLFGSLVGFPVGLIWLDYGLARKGMSMTIRSGIWAGIAVALLTGSIVAVSTLSVLPGLAIVCASAIMAFGLGWLVCLARASTRHASMSRTTVAEDLTSYALAVGTESAPQIQGAYRLTFAELFTATSCFYMARPRFFRILRAIAIPLPRSISLNAINKLAFNHPYRNRVFSFSVNTERIVWKAEVATESVASWDQVAKVMRTPTGFLLYWNQQSYEWMPLHAFFAQDGPEAFAELAQRLTAYSEMPKETVE
jgi:hypothetical protein